MAPWSPPATRPTPTCSPAPLQRSEPLILVDLEKVGVRRPDRALFEDLSLTVSVGDRLAVVGRNGAGKSTLLRVLAGTGEPEEGVMRRGRGMRVGFLDQDPHLPDGTVRSAVAGGPGSPQESGGLGSPQESLGWEAAAVLDHLGMTPLVDAEMTSLSGGQRKRVALARLLVEPVDLLILDEPTNHLDVGAIAWLEERLAAFRGGLVLVTHDRHVLDRVTTRILELDRGRGYVHEGGYASYLEAKVERAMQEATAEGRRRNLARAELAWLRRGAPARTRKSKAHIARATAVVEGRAPPPDRPGNLELGAAARGTATPRLGNKVVGTKRVAHRFDGTWLFRNLDLDLAPAGRLGIVGPNGSGKSTLLDVLAGRITPVEGVVERGPTARLGYYDQRGGEIAGGLRVREAVAGSAGPPSWEQARLLERFWFDTDAQWATVATLSGGERRRLQLMVVLAGLPNVLLLDEPTNDLDLDTLRALEDYLDTWPGSLVVVSHDRAFLERTVEDVVLLDGAGTTTRGGHALYQTAAGTTMPQQRVRPEPRPSPAGSPSAKKSRSPSTLRRLLDLAEREMAEATAERDRLAADLGGQADHIALAAAASAFAAAEQRLAEAEERWLALGEELGI